MARKGNVNSRGTDDELERPVRHRKYKYRFLIVCEDENTEPAYFRRFKEKIPEETIYLKEVGTGRDQKGVVERAIVEKQSLVEDARKSVDEVWVVFDKDDANLNATRVQRYNDAFDIAATNGFKVAHSNEVFELWLLLHLQEVNANVPLSRVEIYQRLQAAVRLHVGFENFTYNHGNDSIVAAIATIGDQDAAKQRAEELVIHHAGVAPIQSNPVTFVHRLVIRLEELIEYYGYED